MRSSIILTAVLAGGALATPVKKWLEKRVVVTNTVTLTTVVWVTAGEAPATVQAAPAAVAPKKVAIHQPNANRPHRNGHHHKAAQPVKAPEPSTTPSPPPPPPSSKPAEAPVQQQPPSTSSSPPPVASPKIESTSSGSSGSTKPPTNYPKDLDAASDVYKALALQHHNIHRANHSASDLTWDDNLASYAEESAKKCVWAHDQTPGAGVVSYGQNIAAGTPAGQIASILTNGFYNNEMMDFPGYGSDNPDMSKWHSWGHFSQMVWKKTEKVGCYTAVCSPPGANPQDCNPATGQSYLKDTNCGRNGGMAAIFTVCNYSPPGNFGGQYSNVGAPLGHGLVWAGDDGVTGL